jgi:hypothetical protein
MRNWYKTFCWKTGREGKLGKPRRRREDSIRMHLRETGE